MTTNDLTALLQSRGLQQKDLCKMTGYANSTVSGWCCGVPISAKAEGAILKALGLTPPPKAAPPETELPTVPPTERPERHQRAKITPTQAAKALQMSLPRLQEWLEAAPDVGRAWRNKGTGRWAYEISPPLLKKWMGEEWFREEFPDW